MDQINALRSVIAENLNRDLNEADTRHRIIDFVLHDFLAWPRNRVATEEFIAPGFADYVLKKVNDEDLLFIEAKKEGLFFQLPLPSNATETSCYIGISKLLSDSNIRAAITQVRTYCFDNGCEFACITNGHEWIFFKTFEKGKRWESLQAFVIRGLKFFESEYTKATNSLSFLAITDHSSLHALLTSSPPKDRTIYFPKEKIASYAHKITSNRLAARLRPVVSRYFGVINDDDTEFMERCYVAQREYQGTSDGLRAMIQDSLSPYLAEFGVQQLDDTGKGGRLGGRLTKNIKEQRLGEVLVLFGGKGSGKSTFVKRLLHHNTPRWLRDHAVIAVIDLLHVPEDTEKIRDAIWNGLVEQLDRDKLLSSDRAVLLAELFAQQHEIALKQELAGLPHLSEAFNLQLNQLVSKWKSDKPFCAGQLVEYWSKKSRGAIVVLDNTDQYSASVQDYCFSAAQEISSLLKCVVLISMREERFHESKIHGVLDAFQNSGFHISSPRPSDVFRKRLEYTTSILRQDGNQRFSGDQDFARDCCTYLEILNREFSNDQSPLNGFLSACAHGDTRLSLDLFRSFLLSGYTNVDEMITEGNWHFRIHQVIKPVMIPERYYYDESLSAIPNMYQLRSSRHSSHFTALRILRKLGKSVDISAPPYFGVAYLRTYFAETFNMVDDFEKNLDLLLRHGFVEANNRLDAYSEALDSVKITNYGLYMLNDLAKYFTYLDLVCTDCGIYSQSDSNYLIEAARQEYALFMKGDRVERVRVRLDRVDKFIAYLEYEEAQERDLYSLGMPTDEMFTYSARQSFDVERRRVLRSARRQPGQRSG